MGQRRKNKLAGDVAAFLRQYGRKAYPTHDPNDRGYDRALETKIKRMRPEELDLSCETRSTTRRTIPPNQAPHLAGVRRSSDIKT